MLPYIESISNGIILTKELYNGVTNIFYTGMYSNLINPTSVWNNGKTFVSGYLNDANNTSVVIEYDEATGIISHSQVFTPTFDDPLKHAFPALLIKDDYIYTFQVDGHGKPIVIYKSNSPNTVQNGFSHFHTISDATYNFAYPQPRLEPDGSVSMLCRWTEYYGGSDRYRHLILRSQPNDLTIWSILLVTADDYVYPGVRHYPFTPYYGGTNTKKIYGIQLRNDATSPETYFGQAFYEYDYTTTTVKSLDGTFTKDISVAPVTTQEIKDHLLYFGSYDAKTTYIGGNNFIVINDVIYGSYFDASQSRWKFTKIINGVVTEYEVDAVIDNMNNNPNVNGLIQIKFLWNGENLLVIIQNDNGGRDIYGCDLNFNGFFLFNLMETQEDYRLDRAILPYNLKDIQGDYMIAGSDDPEVFPYYITNEKFKI